MKNIVTVLVLAALLDACSTPPVLDLNPQGITRAPSALPMELKTVSVVAAPSVSSTEEMAGASLLLLWKDSIEGAVDQARIFKDDAQQKVTIKTVVNEFKYNRVGVSNTLEINAHYSLIDRSNENELFKIDVATSATCSMGDEPNWAANGRIISIVNDAVRENIKLFVAALSSSYEQNTQKVTPVEAPAQHSPALVCS